MHEDDGKIVVDVLGAAAKKLGGRVLNGVVERHFGIDNVDVSGTIGMAGTMASPVLKSVFSARDGEPWLATWQRRIVWSFGLAGAATLVVGGSYLAWKYLGGDKKEEEEE